MREVGHTARDRPLLYHLRDNRRDCPVKLLPLADGCRQAGEDLSRAFVGALLPDAEGVDAEVLGGRAGDSVLIEPWSDPGRPIGELLNEGFTLADCRCCHGVYTWWYLGQIVQILHNESIKIATGVSRCKECGSLKCTNCKKLASGLGWSHGPTSLPDSRYLRRRRPGYPRSSHQEQRSIPQTAIHGHPRH